MTLSLKSISLKSLKLLVELAAMKGKKQVSMSFITRCLPSISGKWKNSQATSSATAGGREAVARLDAGGASVAADVAVDDDLVVVAVDLDLLPVGSQGAAVAVASGARGTVFMSVLKPEGVFKDGGGEHTGLHC